MCCRTCRLVMEAISQARILRYRTVLYQPNRKPATCTNELPPGKAAPLPRTSSVLLAAVALQRLRGNAVGAISCLNSGSVSVCVFTCSFHNHSIGPTALCTLLVGSKVVCIEDQLLMVLNLPRRISCTHRDRDGDDRDKTGPRKNNVHYGT